MPRYRAVWSYKADKEMGYVEADNAHEALKIAIKLVDEQPVPEGFTDDDYVSVEDENGGYVYQDM